MSVALNLYNYAHALAVALFLNVRYALYALVFHKVGYVLNELGFVYLIGQFGNYYALTGLTAAVAHGIFFYFGFGAHYHAAPARAVSVADIRPAHNESARGIVGRGYILHKLVRRDFGIVYECANAVYYLAQVVRRYVGCHAYGYAVGAVYQKVGKARRENGGLL